MTIDIISVIKPASPLAPTFVSLVSYCSLRHEIRSYVLQWEPGSFSPLVIDHNQNLSSCFCHLSVSSRWLMISLVMSALYLLQQCDLIFVWIWILFGFRLWYTSRRLTSDLSLRSYLSNPSGEREILAIWWRLRTRSELITLKIWNPISYTLYWISHLEFGLESKWFAPSKGYPCSLLLRLYCSNILARWFLEYSLIWIALFIVSETVFASYRLNYISFYRAELTRSSLCNILIYGVWWKV